MQNHRALPSTLSFKTTSVNEYQLGKDKIHVALDVRWLLSNFLKLQRTYLGVTYNPDSKFRWLGLPVSSLMAICSVLQSCHLFYNSFAKKLAYTSSFWQTWAHSEPLACLMTMLVTLRWCKKGCKIRMVIWLSHFISHNLWSWWAGFIVVVSQRLLLLQQNRRFCGSHIHICKT